MERMLALAMVVFAIGAYGVITRRNLLVVLMSIELMFNGVNIALVGFARMHQNLDGHVFVMMVMAVAAAEVAVGLAILIALYRNRRTVDSAAVRDMKG